jgi:hypothetical protein
MRSARRTSAGGSGMPGSSVDSVALRELVSETPMLQGSRVALPCGSAARMCGWQRGSVAWLTARLGCVAGSAARLRGWRRGGMRRCADAVRWCGWRCSCVSVTCAVMGREVVVAPLNSRRQLGGDGAARRPREVQNLQKSSVSACAAAARDAMRAAMALTHG